jgi:hypothetical protein
MPLPPSHARAGQIFRRIEHNQAVVVDDRRGDVMPVAGLPDATE